MTNVEIGLICSTAGLLIHQLAFQPRWTAKIVESLIKDVREHAKRCDEELAAFRAIFGQNQIPAE